MVTQPSSLADLYTTDETAWLEATARLVAEGRFAEVDTANLIEYLTDMAKRDRREVKSRLIIFLVHLLKYTHQPDRRSTSWVLTLLEQQRELVDMLDAGSLRNH